MTHATINQRQESNIQVKLSLDSGLADIWMYLIEEYKGLDKASIMRLALNNLAKQNYKGEKAKPESSNSNEPTNEELMLQASRVFNVSSKSDPDDFNFNKSALKPIDFSKDE